MARLGLPRLEFVGRFARNRGALLGACLVLLVALAAVLAPVFFPADPLRIVGTLESVAITDAASLADARARLVG